jgi:Kef-type K+ transport system membrane component KefB
VTLVAVSTLALITLVAVVSPIIAELTGGRIPDVVIQLGLGILIGPQVLAIAHPDSVVKSLSEMGLSSLMFLAGYELDLARVKGRPMRLAVTGWAISILLALGVAFVLVSSGLAINTVVVGLALTTTALGTLLPVLRDAGLMEGRFGAHMMAIGTVGEFGPVVAVAVLLDNRRPVQTGLLLLAFVAVAVSSVLLAARPLPPRVSAVLHRHLQSSAQLPVRISVLVNVGLVYFAYQIGLDVLLGAFAAGIAVHLFTRGDDHEVVTGKLEAIGYGFLVPIFFIVSGIGINLQALFAQPKDFLRLPLFLALFFVVRGVPALLLYRREVPRRQRLPLALLSATGLPLIVVITTIGVAEGRMLPANAAALVGAGILSVLLYPMTAKALLGAPQARAAQPRAAQPTAAQPRAVEPTATRSTVPHEPSGYLQGRPTPPTPH